MYYGRKKGIIIGVIILVTVILLAIISLFIVLKTDLFKSNKTLFWKYMQSGLGNIKIEENAQLQDIEKLKAQNPYTLSGELTASSENEEINNTLEKLKLSMNGQADKVNKYAYTNAKLQYANATIFNLDYNNTDNIYALKSDEIVTVYLGIRNENLQVLLQKLGITNTSSLPNRIEKINYAELFKFTNEELEHINKTYTNVIVENISEDSYSRQTDAVLQKDGVSYNTTSYRLDLTGIQISEVLVNILNTLKTDSITLNLITTKAKTLGLSEEYTTIDSINGKIDEMISKVQETEFSDISFVVYNYKGETISTEIIVKNEQKITVYNESEKIKIILEDLSVEPLYGNVSIEILGKATTTQSNENIKVNIDDKTTIELDIINTGSATQRSLNTNYNLSITNENNTIELSYNQTIEFVDKLENIEKLDENTNCAVLNDYSQEDLSILMQALLTQIVTVYNQKVQMIGIPTL